MRGKKGPDEQGNLNLACASRIYIGRDPRTIVYGEDTRSSSGRRLFAVPVVVNRVEFG